MKIVLFLIVTTGLLGVSGCGSDSDTDQVSEPKSINAAEAVELLKGVDCMDGKPVWSESDPVGDKWRDGLRRYDGEEIVAVGYCVPKIEEDVTKPLLYEMKQIVGDPARLAEILSLEDKKADPNAEPVACLALPETSPNLWLVTNTGEVFMPQWPTDECSHLQNPVTQDYFTDATLVDLT